MTKRKGSGLRVAVSADGFTWNTLTTRADTYKVSAPPVDVTDADGDGWRESLDSCGIVTSEVNVSGLVTEGAAMDVCQTSLDTRASIRFRVTSSGDNIVQGYARVTSLERTAEHNGAERFSLSMEVTGQTWVNDAALTVAATDDSDSAVITGELGTWETGSVMWPMDEGTGSTFYDEYGGNPFARRYRSGTNWPPVAGIGAWGALGFLFGTRDYTDPIPEPTGKTPLREHGFISCWLYQPASFDPYSLGSQWLSNSGASQPATSAGLIAGNNLRLVGSGLHRWNTFPPDPVAPQFQWNNLIISWHTTQFTPSRILFGKLFVNGSLIYTRSEPETVGGAMSMSGLYIGNNSSDSCPGYIRNLRKGTVGDRELTDAEALEIYNADAL